MKVILLMTVFMCISFGQSARILVAAPSGTKSHKNAFVPLAKELVKRGHDVTIITNYATAEFQQLEGMNEIVLSKLAVDLAGLPGVFQIARGNMTTSGTMELLKRLIYSSANVTTETFEDQRIADLLSNSHFDLVYASLVCKYVSLPLARHFKAPIIGFLPNVLIPGWAPVLGDSEHSEYVPFLMTSYTNRMNLHQRTINTLLYYIWPLFDMIIAAITQPTVNKYLPECPAIKELEDDVDLIFTNSHPSFTYPRTLSPEVIEIGAMQCTPAKPLPSELEEFVSSSKDGFILFAIGSLLPMNEMPEDLIQAFIKTFALLPQRVIWQWKGNPRSDLPDNIKTVSWLPQQDLLGHKNCRLFLTHGGLNSIQEALYHGVPLLGLPFSGDQFSNLKHAFDHGYALQIEWKDVTEETLSASIHSVLHNQSFSDSIKKRSLILRDQLQTPLERAVYWMEFVLRHNGTQHLRLGSRHLSFYQRALVDVHALLILSILVPMVFMFFVLRRCCRCCCASKKLSINLPKKVQ